MKTRTEDLAYEWGLDFVEVTQGVNGFPKNTYKALIGFDTYEDAYAFADEVGGEMVVLSKRDGHQLWSCSGACYEPLYREDYIDNEKEDAYTTWQIADYESWAKGAIEQMLGEGCDLCDIKTMVNEMCKTYEEICDANDWEIVIVNKSDFTCNTEHKVVTKIHDDDVTTYAIAVVDHETDEDETNEEEED